MVLIYVGAIRHSVTGPLTMELKWLDVNNPVATEGGLVVPVGANNFLLLWQNTSKIIIVYDGE